MNLNIKSILVLLMIIVSSSCIFSDWCYQEYANESNSCGSVSGYYTGILDPEISCTSNNQDTCMIDGDWDTFQNSVGDGFDFYSIYNINSSVVGGIFQTKDDEFGISNYTLNDNCLFNNNGTLKIRITYSTIEDPEEVGDDFHFQEIYCLDQNNNVRQTIDIRQYSGNENYYEDGINWNIVENPTYCYQESANISTSCGGKNTGYYNITGMDDPQLATDGDWTTYGINGVYRVIYDKPENVTTAKIQYKCDGGQGVTTWNYTLNDDCLFNTNDFFQISINYNSGILTCRNSTSDIQYIIDPQYSTLEYEASTVTACDSGIYEEAIYWILPTSEEETDTTPPSSINGLVASDITNESIYWEWVNPSDLDFNHTELYLDDVFLINTSDTFVNVSGLSAETNYTIKIYSVDTTGNRNESYVYDTTQTQENPDTTSPQISFTSPTPLNGVTINSGNFSVAVTTSDEHYDYTNISLYNVNGTLLQSYIGTSVTFVVGLVNATYYYNATSYDLVGNYNSTITQNISIDTTLPIYNVTVISDYVSVMFLGTVLNETNDYLQVRYNFISINDSRLNVPSIILFTNLSSFYNPLIVHNGVIDTNQVQYNLTYNSTLHYAYFQVNSWSNYSLVNSTTPQTNVQKMNTQLGLIGETGTFIADFFYNLIFGGVAQSILLLAIVGLIVFGVYAIGSGLLNNMRLRK